MTVDGFEPRRDRYDCRSRAARRHQGDDMGFAHSLNGQDYFFFALMLLPVLAWVAWVAFTWRARISAAKRVHSAESTNDA